MKKKQKETKSKYSIHAFWAICIVLYSCVSLPYKGSVDAEKPAFEITNLGMGNGITGAASAEGTAGIYGVGTSGANIQNYGGYFISHGLQGVGVMGAVTNFDGTTIGGQFVSNGIKGKGVYGEASSLGDSTTYGGYFSSKAAKMGYGVYGDANGKNSVGVCGVATSLTDGKNYGGYFMAQGMFGRGVYGKSIGEFGWGTTGMAYGEKGRGVYGEAVKEGDYINYGGYFIARGKKGIGIWAKGGAQGYAAWFQGTTKTNVLEITGGSDLSEKFKVRKCNEIMPLRGMVVCIDQENSGDFIVCSKAYDNKVAGIISGAGGIKPGMILGQNDDKTLEDQAIALAGKVYCLADATYGAINPGDLLTTSETIGHAIKVDDYNRAQGAILGKAMSSLHDGKGLVLILVTLQ